MTESQKKRLQKSIFNVVVDINYRALLLEPRKYGITDADLFIWSRAERFLKISPLVFL